MTSTASSTSTSTASSARSTTSSGVYVDVDRHYNNPEGTGFAAIDIKPGYQRLVGSDALAYVRYRHTDSDIFRNARQQEFLRQAAQPARGRRAQEHRRGRATSWARCAATSASTRSSCRASNLAGMIKTAIYLAVNHAPVNQISLASGITESEDPTADTRLYISNDELAKAYDQFMTGGARRATRSARPRSRRSPRRRPRSRRASAGWRTPAGWARTWPCWRAPRLKTLPFYFPEYRDHRLALRQRRAAHLLAARREGQAAARLPDRDLHRRARRVLRRPGHDVARPAAASDSPDRIREINGRKLMLYYDGIEAAPGRLAHAARRSTTSRTRSTARSPTRGCSRSRRHCRRLNS